MSNVTNPAWLRSVQMQTQTVTIEDILIEELDAIEAELARRSLRVFVEKVWPIVEPKKPFHPNWHIDVLCEFLEKVSRGEVKQAIINVPPGSMKSLLVSVIWPAWEWATTPSLRYLIATYNSRLSIRDNLKLRRIVTSEWYKEHFDLRLDESQSAKQQFNTTDSGWRLATSVGGHGTGEHPDRIIIDDPINAKQARSDVEREAANTWFDETVSSRVSRDPAILVIMQRLHEDDLSGHLLAKGGWEHVCFLMRYQTSRKDDPNWKPDPRDPRTEDGELFWPEHFPEKEVRKLELNLGPFAASGQLQQNPVPEGGGLFKRQWFDVVEEVPRQARRMRGWDTAGTADGGDWTVGVKIAEYKDVIYIEDVVRLQLSPNGVDELMLNTAKADGIECGQREEKEGGSAGLAVVSARAKLLKGYDYSGVTVTGDKVTRAKPVRSQAEARNVKIKRAAWNDAYLSELGSFPVGKHDDQIDGTSCAYNAIVAEAPVKTEATW